MSLYGPVWPLKKGEDDLFEMNTTLQEQINFEFKNLLMTHPGENISDPEYGVGIRSFLFEQFGTSAPEELVSSIRSQTSRYMPSIRIENVQIPNSNEDVDAGVLSIRIFYRIADSSFVFDLDFLNNFIRF